MRQLLVFGPKTFKITVPDEAKITFGPWSPPTSEGKYSTVSDKALNGTLRVYETAKAGASVLAVFSGVTGYRDMSIEYAEEVAREEGAVIWKSDKDGYKREEKVSRASDWVTPVIGPGRKVSPGRKNSDDEL
jgi:hypothetical protein